MKVLIMTAHPDDMETAVGGLACRLIDNGYDVYTIVATSGRRGKELNNRPIVEVREEESRRAHELIGAVPVFLQTKFPLLNLETGSLPDTPQMRKFISHLVNDYEPGAVFTFWPVDIHPDHRVIGSLAMNACLQKGMNREIFCFEVWAGTTEPYPQSLHFLPTHYVDITGVGDRKAEMIFSHKSQNPGGLWNSNMLLWRQRAEEYRSLSGHQSARGAIMEAFVRLTRKSSIIPELQDILLPARI